MSGKFTMVEVYIRRNTVVRYCSIFCIALAANQRIETTYTIMHIIFA
jgi:hypothetical protein